MYVSLYSPEHYYEFAGLLKDFQKEVFGASTEIDVDRITASSWVYLVHDDRDTIGFAVFSHKDYCGLREPVVAVDFLHVDKDYRRSKALHMLTLQIGAVCEDLGLPMECAFATEGSLKFGQRIKGKKVYETFIYEPDIISKEFSRLKKIVKIK